MLEMLSFMVRLPIFFAALVLGTMFWVGVYAIRVPFLPVTFLISWVYATLRNDARLLDDHCGGLSQELADMYRELYCWLYDGGKWY